MFISIRERVEGMLIGLAAGDALGAPFEGAPSCRLPVQEMLDGGLHPRKAGEVTDDTVQAMAVAGSLVHCAGFCPGDLVTRLVAGYVTLEEWYGPTSSAVFNHVIRGWDPYDAARSFAAASGGRETNGSVMRGAPLGVAFTGPRLDEVSLSCSRLTHAGNRASWCSTFINRMVSGLIRGSSRQDAWQDACRSCKDPGVLMVLAEYPRFDIVPSIDALSTTHAALCCFMETSSFAESVGTAAALGGDSDTIAAICGAMAGSYYGIPSIPASWRRCLQYRDSLSALARRLYDTFLPSPGQLWADLRMF